MNSVSLNLHNAVRIKADRKCINGQWQLQLTVYLEDDAFASFAIFAGTREALEVIWREDEHVRITGGDARIEYSPTPFAPVSLVNTEANQ